MGSKRESKLKDRVSVFVFSFFLFFLISWKFVLNLTMKQFILFFYNDLTQRSKLLSCYMFWSLREAFEIDFETIFTTGEAVLTVCLPVSRQFLLGICIFFNVQVPSFLKEGVAHQVVYCVFASSILSSLFLAFLFMSHLVVKTSCAS